MTTKVWFNRWFSVAYHYMNLIRDNEEGRRFQIYATHPDPDHMSLQGADIRETEPDLQGKEYVDFCLDFCRRHQIDVFIPRLHMYEIATYAHLFEEIGTKLMICHDLRLLEQMMDKHQFYMEMQQAGLFAIPEYRIANTAASFLRGYEELVAAGVRKVCFKPCIAEGGMGFRIIDNKQNKLQDLFGTINFKMTLDETLAILGKVESFPDLMLMEYLDGPEYSIDCLADGNQLLAAVPRRKAGGRLRLMEEVPELIELANQFTTAYSVPPCFNIQVKYSGDTPKLLEINPRMSGGLHISCLSGINFPYLAVKVLLEEEVLPQAPVFGILATHVERSIIINRQQA